MLRQSFVGVVVLLGLGASAQAGMYFNVSKATILDHGLVSRQISAVSDAGEIIAGISNPSLQPFIDALGAHQVFIPLTDQQTATRQQHLNAGILWSDNWLPYDSYFFFTDANSLKAGSGQITETITSPGGAVLSDEGFGPPPTGFGSISTVGGPDSRVYTIASGMQGTEVPIAQIVTRRRDLFLFAANIINTQGGQQYSEIVFPLSYQPPEPSTFVLLSVAMAAVLGTIRRR